MLAPCCQCCGVSPLPWRREACHRATRSAVSRNWALSTTDRAEPVGASLAGDLSALLKVGGGWTITSVSTAPQFEHVMPESEIG